MSNAKTIVRDPAHQGPNGGARMAVGDGISATGDRDSHRGTATIEGCVERFATALDGRIRVTVVLAGGYVDTVTADTIWINTTPRSG